MKINFYLAFLTLATLLAFQGQAQESEEVITECIDYNPAFCLKMIESRPNWCTDPRSSAIAREGCCQTCMDAVNSETNSTNSTNGTNGTNGPDPSIPCSDIDPSFCSQNIQANKNWCRRSENNYAIARTMCCNSCATSRTNGPTSPTNCTDISPTCQSVTIDKCNANIFIRNDCCSSCFKLGVMPNSASTNQMIAECIDDSPDICKKKIQAKKDWCSDPNTYATARTSCCQSCLDDIVGPNELVRKVQPNGQITIIWVNVVDTTSSQALSWVQPPKTNIIYPGYTLAQSNALCSQRAALYGLERVCKDKISRTVCGLTCLRYNYPAN